MKSSKLLNAMVLSFSLTLISCGDKDVDAGQKAESTNQVSNSVGSMVKSGGIREFIPAETPLLMIFANDPQHPMPENFKQKMEKLYGSVGDIIKMAMEENMKKYASKAGQEDSDAGFRFMEKWLSSEGLKKAGLSLTDNEFALYTVDLFPVFRMTLADSHSMEELLDEVMEKAKESESESITKQDRDGHTVYTISDKEIKVMVSLKGNSIVGSFAPSREADQLMSKLLGFEKPVKNILQSAKYHDTISKYNYLNSSLYWINFTEIADVFMNPDKYNTPLLDMLEVQDNLLSADCKAEIQQMVEKFPRMVGGYTLFEEHEMNSHMVIEMIDGLGSKLSTISGRIPSSKGDVAVSYGFSFDIAAAKTLALEFVNDIETTPYKCEHMASLNEGAQTFNAQLQQPLPPFVDNFKGVNVIVNEMDLDLSKSDPNEMIKSLKAKMLLAIDNPEALKGMAEMMMPEVQQLGLEIGSAAVNISSLIPVTGSQIPVNLDHVFMAMGTETLGVSLGEGTDVELTQDVSAESSSDLFNLKISAEFYKKIFSGLSDFSAGLGEDVQKQMDIQAMMMTDMLWWDSEAATINFTDRGFEIDMNIIY